MRGREPPRHELPTIGHDKRLGVVAVIVYCCGVYCSRSFRMTFETLALPDDLPIIEIPLHRRFVCSKCGSREVEVRSEWPDPRAVMKARSG